MLYTLKKIAIIIELFLATIAFGWEDVSYKNVFPIIYSNNLNSVRFTHCNATLFSIEGENVSQCHWITAAHCVSHQKLLPHLFVEQINHQPSLAPVTVKKIDVTMDLAELEIKNQDPSLCLQSQIINHRRPSDQNILNNKIFALFAIEQNKLEAKFSNDHDWNFGYSPGFLNSVSTSLPSLSHLIQVKYIDVKPGMSGALLYGYGSEQPSLGILLQFEPHKKIGYFISINNVYEFLIKKNISINNKYSDLSNVVTWVADKNGYLPTGENSHMDTNKGEENASIDIKIEPLKRFRAVSEGFPLNDQIILLAANGQQIDGQRDFIERYKKIDHPKIVTRPKSGYPDFQIRKNILNGNNLLKNGFSFFLKDKVLHSVRLNGNYKMTGFKNDDEFYASQYHILYSLNDSLDEWPLTQLQGSDLIYEITIDKNMIKFHSARHPLNPPGGKLYKSTYYPEEDVWEETLTFQVVKPTQNDNYEKIYLLETSNHELLTCENRHYLKLICHNENWELSLSLSDSIKGTLEYQLAYWASKKHRLVHYRFGEVKRVP